MCIALKKGTYVRPHLHPKSNKWELMLALRGSIALVIFNEEGVILEIKEGPFTPTLESDFASWAPVEGDERTIQFLQWLENATAGEKYNA